MTDREIPLRGHEATRETYRRDVKEFIGFMKERRLLLLKALREYSVWLDKEHEGGHYAAGTINRKIAAAKNRIRYAFKHSPASGNPEKRQKLEAVLKGVRPRPIAAAAKNLAKSVSFEDVRRLLEKTKDRTVNLMIRFLLGSGMHVSEMVGVRLSDLQPAGESMVEIALDGKYGNKRIVRIRAEFIEYVRRHFHGTTFLFEEEGIPFGWRAVSNRIKQEALTTIGHEVTADRLRHMWMMIQFQRGKRSSAASHGVSYSEEVLEESRPDGDSPGTSKNDTVELPSEEN
ncbi:MAG TPA: site-specific integrase [Spirochaetia bacterium]|nr:site-specific integrase [Spirochaetia bacterium]